MNREEHDGNKILQKKRLDQFDPAHMQPQQTRPRQYETGAFHVSPATMTNRAWDPNRRRSRQKAGQYKSQHQQGQHGDPQGGAAFQPRSGQANPNPRRMVANLSGRMIMEKDAPGVTTAERW